MKKMLNTATVLWGIAEKSCGRRLDRAKQVKKVSA